MHAFLEAKRLFVEKGLLFRVIQTTKPVNWKWNIQMILFAHSIALVNLINEHEKQKNRRKGSRA